ncbi:Dipeptidyl aminopeptidase-like protein 6 [Varanus komodoensis]|nr:Dipeptidyl aminopeptidase-like protein 6 [Varanus komodoensis]
MTTAKEQSASGKSVQQQEQHKGHNQHLELGPGFNGKPVKLMEDWSHVSITPRPRQQPGSSILHQLKCSDCLQGKPHVKRVTEV